MNEEEQRAAVVAEARSWLGTRYHNCADVKGAGVDCGMLIVRVFVDTKLTPAFDPRPYSHDWHLHRSEERYLGFVKERLHELPDASQLGLGDVIVFKVGRCYAHGGIVSNLTPLSIIHAYAPARRVLESILQQDRDLSQRQRRPRFFTYWGRA